MKLEEVKKISNDLGFPCIIPMVRTIKSELKPVDVYATLGKGSKHSFLLESAITGEKIARYSFLGNSPEKIISLKNGIISVNGRVVKNQKNPLGAFRKLVSGYKIHRGRLPKFFGGLLGYFAYDIVRYFEYIGDETKDDLCHNDAEFMFVKDLIVFDHWRDEVLLISNMILENGEDLEKKYRDALRKLKKMEDIVKSSSVQTPSHNEKRVRVKSNFSKERFEKVVEKAKEYIYAGDILQVVLSQRFECPINSDPLIIYQILKEINPSPYMYYLQFDGLNIIGSSPEILVRVEDGKIVVRPIAGTRPRGNDIVEDERLSREMLNDPKERAEHVMLVDLGRNDVGKVSRFGSVEVNEFMAVEKYSHVQHIVSNVVGMLEDGKDAFDALEATLPAGTVSGAPKVRAMEIIEELEPCRRGIYAGCVGYYSFDLDMDMAITIRTIVVQNGTAYVQAGAGIVADSVPGKEYQETVDKGKGMIRAIELAGG